MMPTCSGDSPGNPRQQQNRTEGTSGGCLIWCVALAAAAAAAAGAGFAVKG